MVRSGELCKECGPVCNGISGRNEIACFACTSCGETGMQGTEECRDCNGMGHVALTECPRQFIGNEMTEAINVAGMCSNGNLPVPGGLLDQSAWFLSMWQLLSSEEAEIDAERIKRGSSGI